MSKSSETNSQLMSLRQSRYSEFIIWGYTEIVGATFAG